MSEALMSEPSWLERAVYALAFRAENDAIARALLQGLMQGFFRMVAADRRRGGTRLLDFAREAVVRFGHWRAPILRQRLKLDVNDMGDLGRLQDWEDRVFGVTGHWSERAVRTATKCETECPYAEAAKGAPELCTDVIHALETATFHALNPRYRLVPLERLLSKGDVECTFRHELI